MESIKKTRESVWKRASQSPLFSFAIRALGVIVVIGVLARVGRDASGHVPLTANVNPPEVGARAPDAPPSASASSLASAPPAPPSAAPSTSSTTATSARATAEAPVYLNEADRTELRRLPGVGAKRADAILALRERLGRFHRLEDLLRVKGIGRNTLKRWRPMIRLERAPDAGPTS